MFVRIFFVFGRRLSSVDGPLFVAGGLGPWCALAGHMLRESSDVCGVLAYRCWNASVRQLGTRMRDAMDASRCYITHGVVCVAALT